MGIGKWIVGFVLAAGILVLAGCEPSAALPAASRPALPPPWQECEEGVKFTLGTDLTFEVGTDRLRDRGARTIREVAAMIAARYPDNVIRVYGFTDNSVGSGREGPNFRRNLSWARASAVGDVLQTAGIRGDNIECIGMGPFRPIAHGPTVQDHAANRRVEIVITPRRLGAR